MSLLSNSSIEKYSSIKIEPNLDYFNDSKKRENTFDDYFPFGKPGGGAPNRDDSGRIIAKKPSNQFVSNSDSQIRPPNSKPQANWTYDQHQALRDQKKDEWRKSLLEQVQEKERLKKEEKEKKLLQERIEEEKINSQLFELEKQYKKEIRGELGLPPEPEKIEERGKEPEKVGKRKKESFKESPVPIVKEMDLVSVQKGNLKVYEFNPMKVEYWRAKSDLAVQHNNFKDVISKLKSEADQAHLERNQAMLELDKFRDEMRIRLIDNEVKSQQKNAYSGFYSNSRLDNFKSFNPRQIYISKEKEYRFRPLVTESKFVPLVSAGHNVINTSNNNASPVNSLVGQGKNVYEDIENFEIKHQLAELDLLLNQNIDFS